MHLLETLKCQVNIQPELNSTSTITYFDDCVYATCTEYKTTSMKLLVLNIHTGVERVLDFVLTKQETRKNYLITRSRAKKASADILEGCFMPVPFMLPSGQQLGYFRTREICFSAKIDFQQQKCYITEQIRFANNILNNDKVYPLRYTPWLGFHEKSSTLCRIKMQANSEKLMWTPVKQLQINNPSYHIHSITRDYVLTSEVPDRYQVHCRRSGRVAKLPNYVHEKIDPPDIAMIQRDNSAHLLFQGLDLHLELIIMNEQMVFSESKRLVMLPEYDCCFYGIHNGSFVFEAGHILGGEVRFFKIALANPQQLVILAKAKVQGSADIRNRINLK